MKLLESKCIASEISTFVSSFATSCLTLADLKLSMVVNCLLHVDGFKKFRLIKEINEPMIDRSLI